MRKHLSKTIELLRFNWKTLAIFEIIYRLFGLAIIFPLARQLLYLSVKLTGNEYLINKNLAEYISSPYTILIGIIMFIIMGIYITYEVVVLSILFHSSYYKKKIGIYTLFVASFSNLKKVLKKYHIVIVFSSMIFLFIVEGLHLVGIASTIEIPTIVYEELQSTNWFYPGLVIFIITTAALFIETIFFELQCTIESTNIKSNFKHSISILKKNRPKMIFEFLSVNFVLNLIFYSIYFTVIALVGFMLFIIKDSSVVYPLILTLLYTVYLIVGFLATILLIPINFAWINVWYYEHKTTIDYETQKELERIMKKRRFSSKVINRITTVLSLILVVFIIFIFTAVSDDPSHLELFNTPSVISHRGGGKYAPENTLSAISMGIDFGADSVEFDVRFTSDGVPILMHDATLGRTTNDTLDRRVDSLTLHEIKFFDAGSWYSEEYEGEEIPTLEEAIEIIDFNIEIFIELKADYVDADQIIVDIIEAASVESRVKILSFDKELLEKIKMKNDKIETVLLLQSFVGDIDTLKNIDYIDYYAFKYAVVTANKEYIISLQQAGKGVYVWTVNDEPLILEMIQLNVDGIITDAPLLTRELIYSDSLKSQFTKLLEILFVRD